jgi:hypothetical protein
MDGLCYQRLVVRRDCYFDGDERPPLSLLARIIPEPSSAELGTTSLALNRELLSLARKKSR